ncbi:MAG: pyrophosphate synthase [Gammaproteobacteria bacterium]|jgi:undecaprenyl diphosphate synthase|nr:pyrophosphate synthase [Gammaproteobacteria bacterium]
MTTDAQLPDSKNAILFPRHVAIIMDGNGRWAKKRHLPRLAGHKAGIDAVRKVVEYCVEKKIEVLTLFAFGSENWRRPQEEINHLMQLFFTALENEAKKLHEQNIQLRVIGNRVPFEEKLQKQIITVEMLTRHNTGLKLLLAVNYSGRWDMTQAAQQIVDEFAAGGLINQIVTPELIQKKLSFADLPDPDLFIRTSGEKRLSNFILWQLAYTELYFTDVLWPDFNADELAHALAFFSTRERRFGYTSEQLKVDS